MEKFLEYFLLIPNDYTIRVIFFGTLFLGIVSGALGSFAVLRKQSLLGDTISHAALPGIVIAFLIAGKSPVVLFLGAFVSGLVGTFLIELIKDYSKLKMDTILGIILSVFFGFGLVLLTYIQKLPNANKAGLDKFLFGQAATLLRADVILMGVTGGLSLCVVILLWKEFQLFTFNKEFLFTLGYNTHIINVVMIMLLVLSIVIGLQTVGVVLMSSMLLAPAAAARQWTNSLGKMVILSGFFGGFSGVVGGAISSVAPKLSTGPLIVLVSTSLVIISFLFAPERGLISKKMKENKLRRGVKYE